MTPARFWLALAFAASISPAVQAQYVADTGRTEKPSISWSSGGASASATDTTATATATPVTEIQAAEFHLPAVQEALLASGIDRVALQSEGVTKTMNTFAEIMVHAITGRKRYAGQEPLYTVLSMIYQNPQWMRVPMLPVGSPKLAELFGLDPSVHNRVSCAWVLRSPQARPLVMGMLSGTDVKELTPDADTQKALKKFAYRMATFMSLPDEFKLMPIPNSDGAWVSPVALGAPETLADDRLEAAVLRVDRTVDPATSVMRLHAALEKAFHQGRPDDVSPAVAGLLGAFEGEPLYMAPHLRWVDYWNTRVHPFQLAAWIYILAAVAFGAYLFTARRRDDGTRWTPARTGGDADPDTVEPSALMREALSAPAVAMAEGVMPAPAAAGVAVPRGVVISRAEGHGDADVSLAHAQATSGSRGVWAVSYALMAVATLVLLAALVGRFLLAQRMPVSNLYESITFALGAFGVVALVFEGIYRRGWVGAAACVFGWGLMTLANSLPLHMRKVEPLVAVLDSFWLNYHVTTLLVSYAAFLMAFVFCVMYFVKDLTGNRPGVLPQKEVFEYLNYRSVQVGWPLLTLGIFLGAVWANTAWGNAWSWDPKETWALITWFVYTIFLHLRMNLGWTGRKSIFASMFGFLMMLITYFGVNYLPYIGGGMHSYAEPIAR